MPDLDPATWAEFERLRRYAETEKRVQTRPTDLADDELTTKPPSGTLA